MIHEVLLSLWHGPQHLSRDIKVNDWLDLANLKEFLHPCECEVLERIMKISLTYHEIQAFIKAVENHKINLKQLMHDEDRKYGNYCKAFCRGLSQTLHDYQMEIMDLECKILNNTQLTLSYVLSSIEKYFHLFDVIKSMIRIVEIENVYGCLLIGKLHLYVNYGIPSIVNASHIILQSVNTVFYRHLANWIIYGDLVDLYNEFFIHDMKCDDENFIYPEQLEISLEKSSSYSTVIKSELRKLCKVRKFVICLELLPSILPLKVAETILFMGRIVWIIRNDPRIDYSDIMKRRVWEDNIWQGKSIENFRKIQDLERFTFNLSKFDQVIDDCRLTLSKYLCTLIFDESKLLDHLQMIRDYYALGRGELFQRFIVLADEQLKVLPDDYISKNLNYIFHETARKFYSDADKTYEKFTLTFQRAADTRGDRQLVSNIELYFNVQWPLYILFHPQIIALYNKLFSFLIKVKATQMDLHALWLDHVMVANKNKIDRDVWRLRHELMFLVNNIQYYLQVDVIESEFSILKNSLRTATEFNEIFRLHSVFLGNLLSKSFLMNIDDSADAKGKYNLYQLPTVKSQRDNQVYKLITLILELCQKFCFAARTGGGGEAANQTVKQRIEEMKREVDLLVVSLLRSLYSLHEQLSEHHLLQLLLRLHYNRWYTHSKPDLNLTVVA